MKHSHQSLQALKGVSKIPMLTAYTAPMAHFLEQADVAILLVGDSLGMTEMGLDNTRDVKIEHMLYHTANVRRGAPHTYIVSDFSYGSDNTPQNALKNGQALIAAGADAVKLEGDKADIIRHLVQHGIDVVGHIGLTPQTATNFKQVGKDAAEARCIKEQALDVQDAGASLIVLEHMPADLAADITRTLRIPTIGIGAGNACDGQVLVINDLLGLGEKFPPFARQYADLAQIITQAAKDYVDDVKAQRL